MKNALKVLGIVAFVTLFTNCTTQRIIAPSNSEVQLASATEPLSFSEKQIDWYVLFGLVPISRCSSEKIIRENNLKRVRVTSEFTPLNFLIAIFTGFATVTTRTQIIEGSTE